MATRERMSEYEIHSGDTRKISSSLENKGERCERLMNLLRVTPHKSWSDYNRLLRASLDKSPNSSDKVQYSHIQQCIDTLQLTMSDKKPSMVERLGAISRFLSLGYSHSNSSIAIVADMFNVEIILDSVGRVSDVKIHHQNENLQGGAKHELFNKSCQEFQQLLCSGDFASFRQELEGLLKLFSVPLDRENKVKAVISLQSLERDLSLLAQHQSSIKSVTNYIHKSPLGIVIPRRTGSPMKLLYFVSPYDLLDRKTFSSRSLTVEVVMENELGRSVTVNLEPCAPTKLQSVPLMSVNTTQGGNSLPSFPRLSTLNSYSLPACFVLELSEPMPISLFILQQIQSLTNVNVMNSITKVHDLTSLIMEDVSQGQLTCLETLCLTLHPLHHVYTIDRSCGSVDATVVKKIPFTHPTNVPQILGYLRQQLLFNTIVGSCIRSCCEEGSKETLHFELKLLALNRIGIIFEHPFRESMASVELDLSDITSLRATVSVVDMDCAALTEHASSVFQRCMSIPLTLRAILQKCHPVLKTHVQSIAEENPHIKTEKPINSHFPVSAATVSSRCCTKNLLAHPTDTLSQHVASIENNFSTENLSRNPMLASLLNIESSVDNSLATNTLVTSCQVPVGVSLTDSPMLSELLRETDSQSSNKGNTVLPQKKPRKRKSTFDGSNSPRQHQRNVPPHDLAEIALDRKLDSRESVSSLNSSLDFTANESHVSKLAHTVDCIIKSKSNDGDGNSTSDVVENASQISPLKRSTLSHDSFLTCPDSIPRMSRNIGRYSLDSQLSIKPLDVSNVNGPVNNHIPRSGIRNEVFSPPHAASKYPDSIIKTNLSNDPQNYMCNQAVRRVPSEEYALDNTSASVGRAAQNVPLRSNQCNESPVKCEEGNCSDGENCNEHLEAADLETSGPYSNNAFDLLHNSNKTSSNKHERAHADCSVGIITAHQSLSKLDNFIVKEMKQKSNSVANSGKRKKVKDDFKKQRKKRKNGDQESKASYKVDKAVYRTSIDDSNNTGDHEQRMPKLRIRKENCTVLIENAFGNPTDIFNNRRHSTENDSVFNFEESDKLDGNSGDSYSAILKQRLKNKNSNRHLSNDKSQNRQRKPTIKLKAFKVKETPLSTTGSLSLPSNSIVTSSATTTVSSVPVSFTTCSSPVISSKSSTAVVTSRSRKGSLTAVIDKLTKGSSLDLTLSRSSNVESILTAIKDDPSPHLLTSIDNSNEIAASSVSQLPSTVDTSRKDSDKDADLKHIINSCVKPSLSKSTETKSVKSSERPVYKSKSLSSLKSQSHTKTTESKSNRILKSNISPSISNSLVPESTWTSVVDSLKTVTSSKVYKPPTTSFSVNTASGIQPLMLSKGYKIPKCNKPKENQSLVASCQSDTHVHDSIINVSSRQQDIVQVSNSTSVASSTCKGSVTSAFSKKSRYPSPKNPVFRGVHIPFSRHRAPGHFNRVPVMLQSGERQFKTPSPFPLESADTKTITDQTRILTSSSFWTNNKSPRDSPGSISHNSSYNMNNMSFGSSEAVKKTQLHKRTSPTVLSQRPDAADKNAASETRVSPLSSAPLKSILVNSNKPVVDRYSPTITKSVDHNTMSVNGKPTFKSDVKNKSYSVIKSSPPSEEQITRVSFFERFRNDYDGSKSCSSRLSPRVDISDKLAVGKIDNKFEPNNEEKVGAQFLALPTCSASNQNSSFTQSYSSLHKSNSGVFYRPATVGSNHHNSNNNSNLISSDICTRNLDSNNSSFHLNNKEDIKHLARNELDCERVENLSNGDITSPPLTPSQSENGDKYQPKMIPIPKECLHSDDDDKSSRSSSPGRVPCKNTYEHVYSSRSVAENSPENLVIDVGCTRGACQSDSTPPGHTTAEFSRSLDSTNTSSCSDRASSPKTCSTGTNNLKTSPELLKARRTDGLSIVPSTTSPATTVPGINQMTMESECVKSVPLPSPTEISSPAACSSSQVNSAGSSTSQCNLDEEDLMDEALGFAS